MLFHVIKIRNDSGNIIIWAGKEFQVDEEYTIPTDGNRSRWQNDSTVLTAIATGDASIGDGTNYLTDVNEALTWLRSGNTEVTIADETPVSVSISNNYPTCAGSLWRTELETSDISLSTSSYTTLKTLSNGVLQSLVIDFSSDRVDVKINIDGTDIFNLDLDDLEDMQVGSSSNAAGTSGVVAVKTGSKFSFTPPCGLTYTTLTISAQSESNNKKMSSLLINYIAGS